jgi:hypothetical protein
MSCYSEEFLNLANSVADKMRAGTSVEKDILARILLLNIRLDNKNTPSFIWKEPFATVFANTQSSFGAHKVTVVEPDVLERLYQILLNYSTYKLRLAELKLTLRNLIKPDSVLNNSFI